MSWHAYEPSAESPWNLQRVTHLHRRAGFGATWSELQRDLKDGPQASVDRLLNGTSRDYGQLDDFEAMSEVIGNSAANSSDAKRLKAWWLFRMCFSPHPLQEKMALMWHNHFATSNLKVHDLKLMHQQNELFRQFGMSSFETLFTKVVKHPAILLWLDANSNRKGKPNENLAREMMELFSLGIGNYHEIDIQEAARALTGWAVKDNTFRWHANRHDAGEKRILYTMGNFDGDDLIRLLLSQPATAKRVAFRLCELLMGEQVVSDGAVTTLAEQLMGTDLSIQKALKTILNSNLFFSMTNIGTRIKTPVEYVVGTVRALEALENPPSTLILAEWCQRLGQDLFYPPNVGGWKGGRAWLTSRTIIGRSNFAFEMIAGGLHPTRSQPNLSALAAKHGFAKSDQERFFRDLLLPLAKPIEAAESFIAIPHHGSLTNLQRCVVQLLSQPVAFAS